MSFAAMRPMRALDEANIVYEIEKSKMAAGKIEVTASHKLDAKLYDLPLTAKTTIPADWQVVRFRQGSEMRWLPVHRDAGRTFALYRNRIAADGVPAALERGANER